jgi:hypothetical protein
VPNWIDTMGYNQAMFTYRWMNRPGFDGGSV